MKKVKKENGIHCIKFDLYKIIKKWKRENWLKLRTKTEVDTRGDYNQKRKVILQ
jgi:hypothetical protein